MKSKLAFLLSTLTISFWGISFVATKIVVKEIPPITLATLRFSISFFILAVVTLFSSKKPKLSKMEKRHAALAGFWGVTMYFIFENLGVKFTTPSQASLLISTVPIFTIAIADVQRRKRSSVVLYFMSFISLFGVALIVFSEGFKFNYGMLGDILILFAAFSWGMYTLYVDKLERADNFVSTLEMTKWGLFFLIPFSLIEMIVKKPDFIHFARSDIILWLLFLGILCSGLGYVMWNYGVKVLGSRTTSNFLYLIPLISVTTDSVMLKDPPTISIYIGGGLIILGVIVGEKSAKKEDVKVLD